ncbi:Ubiquinone/menaquinone biosynthesis C-methylase UbiE [Pseudonocardia thermophila]|uniref:Ubiquinone/menaquinone biosynthesis C-methylase UbiE n=1 Tax=Pseudonocardia thermophila TaxID=1848 RepID=A0A1M6WCR9_PSETH|nr:class I SAM-dependent methyltransferase [Pseudonocardia thermophila]SHK91532.1 Ubiquinone/menaquinone biosynthesis C-methylase UbiE [Pseudonocardia thermophila]
MTPQGAGKRVDATSLIKSFDAHARTYDRMVGADRNYHEHLRITTKRMGLKGGAGMRLLDVGCGTGASTAALLDAAPEAEVVAVDASGEMLAEARRKTWTGNVTFVQGDVEDLERAGVTGPFDGILAAYLIRNVEDPNAALRTLFGLLKPGAPLALHEYSVRDSFRAEFVWSLVSWGIIIPLGKIRTGDAGLYRYLWRSVMEFDGVEALTTRMKACGFVDVLHQTMPGWQQHILHTFLGRRPPNPEEAVPEGVAEQPTEVLEPAGPETAQKAAGKAAEVAPEKTAETPAPEVGAAEPQVSGFGNESPTPPSGIPVQGKPDPEK